MKVNVLFLYGGKSTEHEISVISAVQAMNNMDKEKYSIIPIYMSKEGKMYSNSNLLNMDSYKNLDKLIKESTEVLLTTKDNDYIVMKKSFPYKTLFKFDIVFPVMHGYNTEDGTIAGFLEVLGVPYCESDIYASVIGQDKVFQKNILASNGIKVTDYIYFYDYEYTLNPENILKRINTLGYPVIVKPSKQGSSVGITVVKNKKDISSAIDEAIKYDDKILVEKLVNNLKEVNCSVVGINGDYKASAIEEVYSKNDLLSFEDKYMSGGKGPSKGMASTGRKIPADISSKMTKQIEEMSINACKAIAASGVVRIDYLINSKTEDVYLNEMNMIPGSLSFYLWTPLGVEYRELLSRIIDAGIKRYTKKAKKQTSFETNVLETFNGTKGVKK